MKLNVKLAFLIFFTFASIFSLINAAHSEPELKMPQWVEVKCEFSNPIEFGAVSNLICSVSAPVIDIEGVVTCALPDTCKFMSPPVPFNFKLKKGEKTQARFTVQFVRESSAKNIEISVRLPFPARALKESAKDTFKNSPGLDGLIRRIDSAAARFEINEKIDFIVTRSESFTDLSQGVYSEFSPEGYALCPGSPEFENLSEDSMAVEIKKYEEFMSIVRKSDELKRYLSTEMDVVSAEDKYLRLLMAIAGKCHKRSDLKKAAEWYSYVVDKALREVRNTDTAEIYIDAMNNYAAVLLADKKSAAAGVKAFLKSDEFCLKTKNARKRYIYYNLGIYYKLNNKTVEAGNYFRKALGVKPNFTICSSELKKLEN